MSNITDRAALHIRNIMARFDYERAVVMRPSVDSYGQPTGTLSRVGAQNVWRSALSKPTKFRVMEEGQVYDMDGMIWVCCLTPVIPAQRGDVVTISGTEYVLRNTLYNTADVRVYWQLEQR